MPNGGAPGAGSPSGGAGPISVGAGPPSVGAGPPPGGAGLPPRGSDGLLKGVHETFGKELKGSGSSTREPYH